MCQEFPCSLRLNYILFKIPRPNFSVGWRFPPHQQQAILRTLAMCPTEEESRAQPLKELPIHSEQDTKKNGENLLDPRWWKIKLLIDLESHCTLIVIHQLNDTPTGGMAVPRLTIRGQEWAVVQFLKSYSFSKIVRTFSTH